MEITSGTNNAFGRAGLKKALRIRRKIAGQEKKVLHPFVKMVFHRKKLLRLSVRQISLRNFQISGRTLNNKLPVDFQSGNVLCLMEKIHPQRLQDTGNSVFCFPPPHATKSPKGRREIGPKGLDSIL
jgi:hypothetical protein